MKTGRIILFIIDSLSLALAFTISLLIRQSSIVTSHLGNINYSATVYLLSFVVAVIILFSVFGAFKLYQVRTIEISARIFTVLKSLASWTLFITLLVYVLKFDFSRAVLFLTVILTALFICLGRYAYFRYRQNKKGRDGENIDVHIIGTGDRSNDIEKQLKNNLPNVSVIKFDYNDPDSHSRLAAIKSDDIFIADEHLTRQQVMEILADDRFRHHSFRVVLDTFRLVTGEVRLNDIDEIPSIYANNQPNTVYLGVKRFTDVIITGISIIVVSPLWLAIGAIIKLDSKGPVLIRQSRVGSDQRPFTLFKFRTMHCDTTLYDYAPSNEYDPRITRSGRILRRLSLDELPQLWNIFKGDMSIVGPRPEMEFIVKKYEPWQEFRLKAKPGLTGLWQILGRKDIPLHENLEYDFYYICNQSLLLDSVIMLKTIPAVLFGRGAY